MAASMPPLEKKSSIPDGLHLLVMVHGLWGNPTHLNQVVSSIADKHDKSDLHILVCKSNSGNYTYDGIEIGGERVTEEIMETMTKLREAGTPVTKISMAGYSLGGLVARYSAGILHAKEVLDEVTPVNFTTFATPHLGVRTPALGWRTQLFNYLGGSTLCTSGKQLFMIDAFRETGRPLLEVLADPNSIFVRGLKRFPERSLYANVVNDRAVPYYTAMMSPTDPFVDLSAIHINYTKGYDDVILDGDKPATPRETPPDWSEYLAIMSKNAVIKAPLWAFLFTLAPFGIMAYMANAGWQTYSSAGRVKAHNDGGRSVTLPLMVEELTRAVGGEQTVDAAKQTKSDDAETQEIVDEAAAWQPGQLFPVLALTKSQFGIIRNMDQVGWRKFPVHIKNAGHSHAAIVVRMEKDSFAEGKVVSRHWIERFVL